LVQLAVTAVAEANRERRKSCIVEEWEGQRSRQRSAQQAGLEYTCRRACELEGRSIAI